MTHRALIALTSHSDLGDSGKSTGFWAEELAVPFRALADAGLDIDLASPAGGRPPVDPNSEGAELDADLEAKLASTTPFAEVDASAYDTVFLVGGHGTMWDFPEDPHLARIVSQVAVNGVVGAVCHGVAGLLGAVDEAGQPLVAGRRVTGFTTSEEEAVGATEVVPFFIEDRLTALGATVDLAEPFASHAIADGRLVTGQNPQSSAATAELLLKALPQARG